VLEKEIEAAVCRYARSLRFLYYKFTSPSRSFVPDRIFIAPGGRMLFVEFKQLGKKPTPMQAREHERLREQGCTVYVIDSVESGKAMIDAHA
jgi:hypothetical protein